MLQKQILRKDQEGRPHRPQKLQTVPDIFKLLMRTIANLLEKKVEMYQPNEQAGFKKEYSTIQHLHQISSIEKSREYNIPTSMDNFYRF